ncbi:hypothetical protein Nmel_005931 [Mimus melanotis]
MWYLSNVDTWPYQQSLSRWHLLGMHHQGGVVEQESRHQQGKNLSSSKAEKSSTKSYPAFPDRHFPPRPPARSRALARGGCSTALCPQGGSTAPELTRGCFGDGDRGVGKKEKSHALQKIL